MSELVKKSINISRASTAWRYLNGVINVYKPAGFDTRTVVNALKTNLCKGKKEEKKTILNVFEHCVLMIACFTKY